MKAKTGFAVGFILSNLLIYKRRTEGDSFRMKRPFMILTAIAAGALVWLILKYFPQTQAVALHASSPARPAHNAAFAASDPVPAKHMAAKAKITDDSKPAGLKGSMVVNLGKVEDIGRKTAEFMVAQGELAGLQSIESGLHTDPTSEAIPDV